MALPKASRPATELVSEPRRDSAWRQDQKPKANSGLNQALRPQAPRFDTISGALPVMSVLEARDDPSQIFWLATWGDDARPSSVQSSLTLIK